MAICDNCGKKGARVRRVTRSFGSGKQLFLISNLPLIACPACGEKYFTAATLHEISRIRAHWRKLSVKKSLPVARFGGAA
ncbi:MAG: YgiT-type zinc finger protein [Planctomycetota bacterium]